MKNYILSLFILIFATSLWAGETVFSLDVENSTIEWSAKKVTGEHNGTLSFKSASVTLDGESVKAGQFEIDMNSIVNLDIKKEAMKERLIGHLKSDDFFSVEKFPVGKFEIDSVTPGEGESQFLLTGKLTLKGITNGISFPARIHKSESSYHATAEISIDRTLWDIRYGSGKFFSDLGDKMIHDEFTVKLDLTLKAE